MSASQPGRETTGDDGADVSGMRQARESLQRQYEAAVRRNRCIPDSFSLAPRRRKATPDA